MSTSEATYATHLHESCVHAKALAGKDLPFGCWTACFRCIEEAS
jgi:hypothetical protein